MNNIDYLKIDRFLSEARTDKEKVDYLSDYITKYPQDDYLNGMYAYFLIGHDIEEAREFIAKKELEINTRGGFLTLASAASEFADGNYDLAEKLYALCKKKLDNKWLYLELFHFESNEEIAEQHLRKCLKLDNNFYYGLINLAYYYYSPDSQCNEVVEIYNKINTNLSIEDHEVINFFALALYYCGEYEKAKFLFTQSINKEANAIAFTWLGNIYSTHYSNLKKAESCFLNAMEMSSGNDLLDLKRTLAWVYFVKGDFVQSEMLLTEIIEQDSSQTFFNDLITFYLKLNQIDEADNVLKIAIQKNGANEINKGYKEIIRYLRNNQDKLQELNSYLNKNDTDIISYFNYLLNTR